jgi:hypothetical protein
LSIRCRARADHGRAGLAATLKGEIVLLFALTTATRTALILAGGFVVWGLLAAMVASYGYGKGFSFWPLFLSGVFLGFPVVLLAIAIAVGLLDEYRLVAERSDGATD